MADLSRLKKSLWGLFQQHLSRILADLYSRSYSELKLSRKICMDPLLTSNHSSNPHLRLDLFPLPSTGAFSSQSVSQIMRKNRMAVFPESSGFDSGVWRFLMQKSVRELVPGPGYQLKNIILGSKGKGDLTVNKRVKCKSQCGQCCLFWSLYHSKFDFRAMH